ncbi:transposase [Pseudomonas petroselini]|uniref:transposase n=1 Tax=Pseudomonas petroselini TaxID=2899822 RepID=UPI003CC59F76
MRQRTAYPQPFKAQVVQEYLHLGVSMPSVPSRYGIYGNQVRAWMTLHRDSPTP